MSGPELVVASHRGPYVYERTRDGIVSRRGGGGLIGAVAPVLDELGGTWIAAALSEDDRRVARASPKGRDEGTFRLRLLDLPKEAHAAHYDDISNQNLWFLFHYLFDVPHTPVFDNAFIDAWDDYRRVNQLYADAISDSPGEAVFVHDYHLMLVGGLLKKKRPTMYFHHTPWCDPEYFSLLPEAVGEEILRGMTSYDVVGFHSKRWADNFRACCERIGRKTKVIVAPVPLDTAHMDEELAHPDTARWAAKHDEMRAGRKLLARVDRLDLSKNALRGFLAFEALLDRRRSLAGEVVFLAQLYPSRMSSEPYRKYHKQCVALARRINERFKERPIALHVKDDYHRSLGALRMYDALLVNPVFDGLNLVAKEGAYANTREGSLILSRNAGVYEELGDSVIGINPFDITTTADAIEEALSRPNPSAARLREAASGSSPRRWVGAHLRAAGLSL